MSSDPKADPGCLDEGGGSCAVSMVKSNLGGDEYGIGDSRMDNWCRKVFIVTKTD